MAKWTAGEPDALRWLQGGAARCASMCEGWAFSAAGADRECQCDGGHPVLTRGGIGPRSCRVRKYHATAVAQRRTSGCSVPMRSSSLRRESETVPSMAQPYSRAPVQVHSD
jgi:hypothetical protein